jgi:N-acetylneuraminate synthase
MSEQDVFIGERAIGSSHPVFIVAEIGINHNGDMQVAKDLIDSSARAGADAVKFQKRTPELCVPDDQKNVIRETPWGEMTYLDYRYRVEFNDDQYQELEKYAQDRNILLFASPWDLESLDFLISHDHPAIKIASACLTDDALVLGAAKSGKAVIASTGMSTMDQIDHAVSILDKKQTILCHTTSSYPCPTAELNIRMINTLMDRFKIPIGYSGHEIGLGTSLAAIALGAVFLERHVTLNRAMWGSDQAASIEPVGFAKLIRDVRAVELALGDGIKKVYDSELGPMKKLRLK